MRNLRLQPQLLTLGGAGLVESGLAFVSLVVDNCDGTA